MAGLRQTLRHVATVLVAALAVGCASTPEEAPDVEVETPEYEGETDNLVIHDGFRIDLPDNWLAATVENTNTGPSIRFKNGDGDEAGWFRSLYASFNQRPSDLAPAYSYEFEQDGWSVEDEAVLLDGNDAHIIHARRNDEHTVTAIIEREEHFLVFSFPNLEDTTHAMETTGAPEGAEHWSRFIDEERAHLMSAIRPITDNDEQTFIRLREDGPTLYEGRRQWSWVGDLRDGMVISGDIDSDHALVMARSADHAGINDEPVAEVYVGARKANVYRIESRFEDDMLEVVARIESYEKAWNVVVLYDEQPSDEDDAEEHITAAETLLSDSDFGDLFEIALRI